MVFNDHFKAEHEGHTIKFEAYFRGPLSYACSLFVDNQKVDSASYGFMFPCFTLRHNLASDSAELRIKVEVKQRILTWARLFVNDEEVPFKRMV